MEQEEIELLSNFFITLVSLNRLLLKSYLVQWMYKNGTVNVQEW